MANVYSDLPATAGNGDGAAVDVSTMGRERTITVQGVFNGTVNIQFSNEGVGGPWATATTFTAPGQKTISIAARFMRASRSGVPAVNPGLPNVDVAANDDGGLFLDLPATPGAGTGASVDVSTLGTFNTVTVLDTFSGTVIIEISVDGTDWAQAMVFQQPGWESEKFTSQFMRVTRKNLTPGIAAGLPNIDVGAINDTTVSGDLNTAYGVGAVVTVVAGTPADWAIDAAGEVYNDSLLLSNDEPATALLNQYAPTLRFSGQYWDTVNTQQSEMEQRLIARTGVVTANPGMSWWGRTDGGAWFEYFGFQWQGGYTELSAVSTGYWSFGGETGAQVADDKDICYNTSMCGNRSYWSFNTVNTIDCSGVIVGNGFNTQGVDDGYQVNSVAGWYYIDNSTPDSAFLTTPAASNAIIICENAGRNNVNVFNGGVAYIHPTLLIYENTETNHTEFAHGTLVTSAGDFTATPAGDFIVASDLAHTGTNLGFYGTAPIAKQAGVPVTAAGIHAACVALGLFI